jgi:hypothetical protein
MQDTKVKIPDLTVQSGRPSSKITISSEAQQDVHRAYLESQRLRFKSEIVRLTKGEMLNLLHSKSTAGVSAEALAFLMSYVYAWHWLQINIHGNYQSEVLTAFTKGAQAFLINMLLESNSADQFIERYINYWQQYQGAPQRQQQHCLQLLEHYGDIDTMTRAITSVWQSMELLNKTFAEGYKELAQDEKTRYANMLGDKDLQRLKLIDQLPDVELEPGYAKMGIIPAMGCPQTCRHCMFIFRPLMKNTDKPDTIFEVVDSLTTSILFTGGDLSKQLDHFYHAIESMPHINTFAILLNGDFADSREVTQQVLGNMAKAVRRRNLGWAKAHVMLQISFDEFHQEVIVNKQGQLEERIPVTKIANIVEAAPKYSDEIQLALLHKQGHLNFSMELFQKGVFARLANELGRRGHQVEVLSSSPSTRLKRNPLNPEQPAQLIKDATFVLSKHPKTHILLTSSTIDSYGRANMMELHEAVNERDLLEQMLQGNGTDQETFDMDMMLWFNGWATLFSVVHLCLGNVLEEGIDIIRQRQAKDPLTRAMHRFDLKLLDFYRERHDDLEQIIECSTSPHHLFHTITEDAEMRLHMTKRLLQQREPQAH